MADEKASQSPEEFISADEWRRRIQGAIERHDAESIIEALAQRERGLVPEQDITVPALKERPSFPPIRCPNPQCEQGSVLVDHYDVTGQVDRRDWVNCSTCRGRGYIGEHPTAAQTLQEVECVYCMYDVDETGDTFEDRKARCNVCHGTGTKSRAFYQRLLETFAGTPTHAPSGPSPNPLVVRGTLTLREALRQSFGAITTLTDRAYRVLVIRDADDHNRDRYFVRTQHVSEPLDAPGLAIERSNPLTAIEDFLRHQIGKSHINPQGWAPFALQVHLSNSEGLRGERKRGAR